MDVLVLVAQRFLHAGPWHSQIGRLLSYGSIAGTAVPYAIHEQSLLVTAMQHTSSMPLPDIKGSARATMLVLCLCDRRRSTR